MARPGTTCEVYGDNRPYKPGATVTLTIDEEEVVLKVCDAHQAFFEDFQADLFHVGFTFTREVEIRPVGQHPAAPEVPEEE